MHLSFFFSFFFQLKFQDKHKNNFGCEGFISLGNAEGVF